MKSCVYTLPCKPGSIYLNFGDDCLNDCKFCVKRFGKFFGYDLETKYSECSSEKIQNGLMRLKALSDNPREIVICGIGEPFLHYDDVIKSARLCKRLFGDNVSIRADTNGLWWGRNPNISFLEHITSMSISLNAESEEKYNQICQPRIPNAYSLLMDFLRNLVEEREKRNKFPEIRLTVVDTSKKELMPLARSDDLPGGCPVPDFAKCRKIADSFGFPLVIKQLFRDSCEFWDPNKIEKWTLDGNCLPKCENCKTRHV